MTSTAWYRHTRVSTIRVKETWDFDERFVDQVQRATAPVSTLAGATLPSTLVRGSNSLGSVEVVSTSRTISSLGSGARGVGTRTVVTILRVGTGVGSLSLRVPHPSGRVGEAEESKFPPTSV